MRPGRGRAPRAAANAGWSSSHAGRETLSAAALAALPDGTGVPKDAEQTRRPVSRQAWPLSHRTCKALLLCPETRAGVCCTNSGALQARSPGGSRAMRVVLYLRVSTTDQDPESQGREIRAFVAARGWETIETYQDVGFSGARTRRPALEQLLKDAWRGRFQGVVVWDLSRMARSTLNALELLREFEQMGVRLIAVKQTFDTDTPLGKAFFTLAAMFAELERSILIERVRAGMARARAEGNASAAPCGTSTSRISAVSATRGSQSARSRAAWRYRAPR